MTRDEFVGGLLGEAKSSLTAYWSELPDSLRLRLAGMEQELQAVLDALAQGLWQLVAEQLDPLAVELHGCCRCGRRSERRKDSVKLLVLGREVEFPCTYLYCRRCHCGQSPVRRWLGLEAGGVSQGFERALCDLTTRMTFGDAVTSMHEHHGQEVDRTKAERVTYAVARQAETYLHRLAQSASHPYSFSRLRQKVARR